MDLIYNSKCLRHDTGMHPENARRFELFTGLPETTVENAEEHLAVLHTQAYIEKVRQASHRRQWLDHDTPVSEGSFDAAVYAVGATLLAAETGGFALVRPPGHHAYPDHSSGFCIFNSIAIAASVLAREGKRVLIFDFDGHLGDGTSKIFDHSNKVLYWSIHQHPAFPGSGFADDIGNGEGRGFTINVPLPPDSGDDIFRAALQAFLPVARQFAPDVVAVSAGFDAHQYDLLLDLRLTVNSFYRAGKMVRDNFGRLFATLEGGYNVEYLPKGVFNFLDGVNGDSMRYSEQETTSGQGAWDAYTIREGIALNALSKYWKDLNATSTR